MLPLPVPLFLILLVSNTVQSETGADTQTDLPNANDAQRGSNNTQYADNGVLYIVPAFLPGSFVSFLWFPLCCWVRVGRIRFGFNPKENRQRKEGRKEERKQHTNTRHAISTSTSTHPNTHLLVLSSFLFIIRLVVRSKRWPTSPTGRNRPPPTATAMHTDGTPRHRLCVSLSDVLLCCLLLLLCCCCLV